MHYTTSSIIAICTFRYLDQLQHCYEGVFAEECPSHQNQVINTLMVPAFEDPHYLRYKYRPDCHLHSRVTSPLADQPDDVIPAISSSLPGNPQEISRHSTREVSRDQYEQDSVAPVSTGATPVLCPMVFIIFCLITTLR